MTLLLIHKLVQSYDDNDDNNVAAYFKLTTKLSRAIAEAVTTRTAGAIGVRRHQITAELPE